MEEQVKIITLNLLFIYESKIGKTFLYNTLIRWCLAGKPEEGADQPDEALIRGSVISAASTGIAALLLIGGGTVHRQFFVPNDVDDTTQSKISFESPRGQQLRAAALIIIDVCQIYVVAISLPHLGGEHVEQQDTTVSRSNASGCLRQR
jgi:hypothetical protein